MAEPDPASKEFHEHIGYCITAWADVEEELVNILFRSIFVLPGFSSVKLALRHTAIIYYRTPSLDARLSLVDEIVRTILPQRKKGASGEHNHPLVKQWNGLIKRCRDLLGTRRRIAHHPVAQSHLFITNPPGLGLLNQGWFELFANNIERLRGKDDEAKPLRLHDLRQHQEDVKSLALNLRAFISDALVRKKEPPRK
jgi:hypothetical protein